MMPNSTAIRPSFVILDLDNTLYEYNPCHSYAKLELIEFLSKNLNLDSLSVETGMELARKKVKERLGSTGSSHSRIAYINEFIGTSGKQVSISLITEAEQVYWSAYFEKMMLRKGALEFLNFVNLLNIRIYLVTDLTLSVQIKKLQKLVLENSVSFIISSEEAGGDKVTNLPFKKLSELLGPTPGYFWAIGDKCWDFPQSLGVTGREFTLEKINCEHEHELIDFDELLDILQNTNEFLQQIGQS